MYYLDYISLFVIIWEEPSPSTLKCRSTNSQAHVHRWHIWNELDTYRWSCTYPLVSWIPTLPLPRNFCSSYGSWLLGKTRQDVRVPMHRCRWSKMYNYTLSSPRWTWWRAAWPSLYSHGLFVLLPAISEFETEKLRPYEGPSSSSTTIWLLAENIHPTS